MGSILNETKNDLLISDHTHEDNNHSAEQGLPNYPIDIEAAANVGKRTLIKVKADEHALSLGMPNDAGKILKSLCIYYQNATLA